jgi:hypothetical protein
VAARTGGAFALAIFVASSIAACNGLIGLSTGELNPTTSASTGAGGGGNGAGGAAGGSTSPGGGGASAGGAGGK